MISVIYDACILFSATLRDLLMNLAVANAVSAHWTDEIHEEWIRNVLKKRPDQKRELLERTRHVMDSSISGGLVCGYRDRIETLSLPDPNDRHVLAAAIHIGTSCIVTNNLKDFPNESLIPFGIEAVSPDEFIFRLTKQRPNEVLKAAREHRRSLRRPAKTVDEYLDSLRRQGLTKTVAFLEEHRSEL